MALWKLSLAVFLLSLSNAAIAFVVPSANLRSPPLSSSFHNNLHASSTSSSLFAAPKMPFTGGSVVAIVTPMTSTCAIDYDKYRSLLQWHISQGTDGICVLGTTSEVAVMSMSERETILQISKEELKGKIPYMVGTGTINPKTCIEYSLQAEKYEADATLIVTPYYVKPTPLGLINHYKSIATAVPDMPIVLYNVPGRTGCDIKAETAALIMKACNGVVIGIKDATGDVTRVEPLRDLCGPDFLLYSGDDETAADFLLKGGNGVISVTSNVVPSQMSKMVSAAQKGDAKLTHELNRPLLGLHDKLFCQPNPIPTKYVMSRMGKMKSIARPPLHALEERFEKPVEEAMKEAGLL